MRSRRRIDDQRMKARARRLAVLWRYRDPAPRDIGRIASTHGRPCSCWMCSGHKEVPPPRERGFEEQL